MAEQHLITAEFFGSPVSIIDHAGKRWLTAEEIGHCLGYGETNARKGISKLYNAHTDEFTEADSTIVNLATVDRKNRDVRIFSQAGCIKLSFFANTPTAKKFRAWAAQTLEAGAPAPLAAYSPPALPGLKMNRHKERIAMEMFVAGTPISEIGRAIGVSRSTASLVLCGKYQFAPGSGTVECSSELIAAVAARHLAIERAALAAAQERAAQRYLTTANNQALANALDAVGRQLQQAPLLALGGAA